MQAMHISTLKNNKVGGKRKYKENIPDSPTLSFLQPQQTQAIYKHIEIWGTARRHTYILDYGDIGH